MTRNDPWAMPPVPPDEARGPDPDDNPRGRPRCHRCGNVVYQPDQFGPRKPARRCAGCHRTTGNCNCTPVKGFQPDEARGPEPCHHDHATCDDCGMGFTALTAPARPAPVAGAECLEVRRLLGYLWTATGYRNDNLCVRDLFRDDDPIVADVERLAIFPEVSDAR